MSNNFLNDFLAGNTTSINSNEVRKDTNIICGSKEITDFISSWLAESKFHDIFFSSYLEDAGVLLPVTLSDYDEKHGSFCCTNKVASYIITLDTNYGCYNTFEVVLKGNTKTSAKFRIKEAANDPLTWPISTFEKLNDRKLSNQYVRNTERILNIKFSKHEHLEFDILKTTDSAVLNKEEFNDFIRSFDLSIFTDTYLQHTFSTIKEIPIDEFLKFAEHFALLFEFDKKHAQLFDRFIFSYSNKQMKISVSFFGCRLAILSLQNGTESLFYDIEDSHSYKQADYSFKYETGLLSIKMDSKAKLDEFINNPVFKKKVFKDSPVKIYSKPCSYCGNFTIYKIGKSYQLCFLTYLLRDKKNTGIASYDAYIDTIKYSSSVVESFNKHYLSIQE